jgi:hypothetical protein
MNIEMAHHVRLPMKHVFKVSTVVCPTKGWMRQTTACRRPGKYGADNRREQAKYQAEYQAKNTILWRKRPKKIEPAAPKFGA